MTFFRIFIIYLLGVYFANAKVVTVSGIQGSLNSEISYAVLSEAYSQIGYTLKWKPLPAERSLRTSNSGEVDGELFRIGGIQRKYTNLLIVPVVINKLQGVVYAKNKDFKVNGWSSLKGSKIGIQRGVKFSENGTKGMLVEIFNSVDELLKSLGSRRIDVAIVSRVNGLKYKDSAKESKAIALRPFIEEFELFHYIHKKNEYLVEKLVTVLLQMKSSGRIDEIRRDYLSRYEVEQY
ncbi:ABC transporter substrate-binding protein [Halobacteriovorax sp. HLS]|uniref:substrate-binding periplasmic protein n=1 Tax=Halobacteriovorax sp. HLS TaxID=2234000 RepID=UPI000FD8998A|nr:transporter substrate-binding domain-containing protein [Halobacteriovorax sp. HLS]